MHFAWLNELCHVPSPGRYRVGVLAALDTRGDMSIVRVIDVVFICEGCFSDSLPATTNAAGCQSCSVHQFAIAVRYDVSSLLITYLGHLVYVYTDTYTY